MFEVRYLQNLLEFRKAFLALMTVLLSACGGGGGTESSSEARVSSHPGAETYAYYCSGCHGSQGQGLSASALNDIAYPAEQLATTITDTMPPANIFACQGSCASDVADYILTAFVGENSGGNGGDTDSGDGSDDSNGGSNNGDDADNGNPSDLTRFYTQFIEHNIVQVKCVQCHVGGGIARDTALVLNSGNDSATHNLNTFSNFYSADADSGGSTHAKILSKVRGGSAHGGGVQLTCDDEGFKNFEQFLQMLGGTSAPGDVICSGSLFDGVSLTSSRETLRRAALIVAGRLPTGDEYTQAEEGDSGLRAAIKGLMIGENFHEFLVRGSNDNLLTKALAGEGDLKFADRHDVHYPELSNRSYAANIAEREGDESAGGEFISLLNGFRYAGAMAPLKLIAYIVENDLPYTEILTADYTMVNPDSNVIFRSGVSFDDSEDLTTFKPGKNLGQILENSDTVVVREDKALGPQVLAHGGFIDYPHAGLLNDTGLLNRYPSTDTNRNRARARFVYYQYQNFDIEKSAARTADPDDLADTNNPTLNNPACTVCHIVMDPVAGAFQNYDDSGHYRGAAGGLNSLPTSYTKPADSLYQDGDLWYRDMLEPGFGSAGGAASAITERDNTLQILAQRMISNEQFSQAAVSFWWPTIMTAPLEDAPEQITDSDYQAKLITYEAQQETVSELAQQFSNGFYGGSPYNVKDLLVDMMISHWFRAESVSPSLSGEREISLASIGIGRLLTPEELALKTKALVGVAWGEITDESRIDPRYDNLNNTFTTYYGGIDSFGITARATELTALMSNVALAQALEMSCPIVITDFIRDASDRRIFKGISKYTTPLTDASAQFDIDRQDTPKVFNAELTITNAGDKAFRINMDNPSGSGNQNSRRVFIDKFELIAPNGSTVISLEGEDLITAGGVAIDHDGSTAGGTNNDNGVVTWAFTSGYLEIPVSLAPPGTYQVFAHVYGNTLSDGINPLLSTSINSIEPFSGSGGEMLIKNQLRELHASFLGEDLAIDSEELHTSYQLFVTTWESRWDSDADFNVQASSEETCTAPEGITFSDNDLIDPQHILATWSRMMLFFMTDYKFLHE